MPTYLIGTIDVEDADTYDLYRALNPALVQEAGGTYIIKGRPVETLEGEDFRSRFVMIEFATEAALKRFYNSPAYEALRPLRHQSAKSSIAFITTQEESTRRTRYQVSSFGPEMDLKPVSVPAPLLQPTQIRIQPTLIAINPIDWKISNGLIPGFPAELPFTPGCEGVGIIEAIGEDVKGLEVGDKVMAFTSLSTSGWYATSVDVAADQCALVPAGLADEKAAALSVALLTAQQTIDLHEGGIDRALVIGASGGVGAIAATLLRASGAEVDALCSQSNADYVGALGARVLSPQDAAQNSYDFVLDAGGGPVIEAGYRSLAEGSTLVSIVQPIDETKAAAASAKAIRYSVSPNGEQLAGLIASHADLPDPRIAVTLPLDQAKAGIHLCQNGRLRGKVLLRP